MSSSLISRSLIASLVALTGTAVADDVPTPTTVEPSTTTTVETTTDDPYAGTSTTTVTTPPPVIERETTIILPPEPTDEPAQPAWRSDAGGDPGSGPTMEKYGIAVALGGGVEGFTNDTLRGTTDPGGLYNLRVAIGTRSPLSIEGAYIGSVQSIDALGLDSNALLVGNGLEGKLRLNLLDEAVQPFAFAGVGWRRYSLRNADFNTSAVSNDDDVIEVPMGLGLAYKIAGLQFDARGEFRYATGEDLMPSLTDPDAGAAAEMHRWSINTNIGYAF